MNENDKSNKPLFSITASDLVFKYTKGSGAGGQKRNKTSNAVHCTHPPSGAKGYSEATRSQRKNKEDAFYKMTQTEEFQKWIKLEISRKTGELERLEKKVEQELRTNVKIEERVDGKWQELKNTPLDNEFK